MKQRLAAIDLVAEPNIHVNARCLRFRRAGELGEPGELAVVDMNDTTGTRRGQRMDK